MIELDVETRRKAAALAPDGPSRYLVLGDFGGRSATPAAIDRDTLDAVLDQQGITLAGARIQELEDFHPDRLYQLLDAFADLREDASDDPPPSREPSAPRPDIEKMLKPSSLLERIAGGGDAFEEYVGELARAHSVKPSHSSAQKDAARAERMRTLLRHPRFQSLEAAWRGLDFVVRAMDDSAHRLYIAQFSKKDLAEDLLETADLRATRLYSLLHAREWRGVFALHSFGAEDTDIELLGRIALLSSNAKTPFIAEGSIAMGDHWEELRSIPETGSIGLALPRFLLRLPYGSLTSPIESFPFEEMPGLPQHSAYLWGNPALACLAILSREAPEEGDEFDLLNLPLHNYSEDSEWKSTPCAEVCLTESQVRALMDLGLMPLISFRDTDRARLAGFRAINGKSLPL